MNLEPYYRIKETFKYVFPIDLDPTEINLEHLDETIEVYGNQNALRAWELMVEAGYAVCEHRYLMTETELPGGLFRLKPEIVKLIQIAKL